MKGIYSMKTYVNPMLQVVSIKKNDIITGSEVVGFGSGTKDGSAACAGDRFREDWDVY